MSVSSNQPVSRQADGGPWYRSGGGSPGTARNRARSDQFAAVLLGALLLGVAVLTEHLVLAPRRQELVRDPETSRSLAVNFPRMTLGGFRGLLATTLWIQAEEDKNNRKWVELETKYDMIGALQPYFISVYIYHAWNQAYNLSAQWHSDEAKYKWVLDGLAYLYKGEDYNPNQPDLLLEQGHMYFLKLGGAYERIFYRNHWRDDISRFVDYNTSTSKARTDQTEALNLVHDFVLRVGPENQEAAKKTLNPVELQKLRVFHTAELPDPDEKTTRMGYGVSIVAPELFDKRTDGKAPGDPMKFRWGLSPFYFAYVEYRRTIAAGMPTTVGMKVADSWPAMSLRLWCRDDLNHAQKTMAYWFGPDETGQHPRGMAEDMKPHTPEELKFAANLADAADCYRNVQMIAPKAVEAFQVHLSPGHYPGNRYIHNKHIKETNSYELMGRAESQLLKALTTWQAAGRKLTLDVVKEFTAALPLYDQSIATAEDWVNEIYPPGVNQTERMDSEKYVNALRARKHGIENLLKPVPGEKPDMSFLLQETVEQ